MALTVITLPDDVSHCFNEVKCQIETDLPLSTDNLIIACALWVELVYNSGTYTVVHTQWIKPDANGVASFFWQTWLADCFEKLYTIPTYGGTTPFLVSRQAKRYYMMAAEHSGIPRVVTDDILTGPLTNVRYAHRGGISKQAFQQRPYFGATGWAQGVLGVPLPFPFPSLPMVPPFMDWMGRNTTTHRGIDESLYFHWEGLAGAVTVAADIMVEYTLEDLSVNTFVFDTITVNQFETWYIPAGFEQLGLVAIQTLAGQNILTYSVYMKGVIGIYTLELTERKTFLMQYIDTGYFTELMYANSLGTFSHLLMVGVPKHEPKVSKNESPAYHELGMPTYLAESVNMATEVADTITQATGYVSPSKKRQFQEMIASRCVMIRVRALGWVRITILTKSIEFVPEKNLHRADISFAYDRNSFTPNIVD